MADGDSQISGYVQGYILADADDSLPGYTRGQTNKYQTRPAFLQAATASTSDVSAFIHAGVQVTDNLTAFLTTQGLSSSRVYSYLTGISRSNIDGYTEGTLGDPQMPEYDYIWLKSSDESIAKKFRVVAQGYDDGTLEKAEDIKRTIGGGIDHSMGAVYKSWNPMIRVRAYEPVSDYGDLQDLIDLYNLNNPGATPNNNITFIDHHGTTYTVHMVSSFRKSLMGVSIEGANAWSLVKITLIEVQV